MTTTTLPNHYSSQVRLHHSLPMLQNDNNSMLLLRSELGQLREQLKKKDRQLVQQQLDMEQLNGKYVAALDQVATIQHEKDLAERELEDLTCRLFEQANMMVANEKREVYRLRTELDRRQNQMELEQMKYKQLLQQHSDIKTPSLYSSSPLYSPSSLGYITMTSEDVLPMDLVYDQQHIQHFQQFIQAFVNKPTLSQHKQHPFLKQCLIGDVEPCLNFGPGNKLHSIKKMIDSMMQQPCILEQVHATTPNDLEMESTPSIGLRWNRFVSGVPSLVDCAGCGNTLNMQHYYRFRLIDSENDWLHLDALCRDRLKSVCTFFGFMRQLSNHLTITPAEIGKDHDQLPHNNFDELSKQSSLVDGPCPLYMEMTRLRLTMFYARSGIKRSCWSADDDATSTISTQGPMTPVSSLSRQISNKPLDEK